MRLTEHAWKPGFSPDDGLMDTVTTSFRISLNVIFAQPNTLKTTRHRVIKPRLHRNHILMNQHLGGAESPLLLRAVIHA